MNSSSSIADHWGTGDIYAMIVSALKKMSRPLDGLTIEDLAPVDHIHARGFPATVDLADCLPIKPGFRVLDIGCGLGGPARYMADRFQCQVTGLDITEPFVVAGNRLTSLLHMDDRVHIEKGDAQHLPYPDESFDGAYAQHVTMNVADRPAFFSEAYRVVKPGGFFALSEHGRGPKGNLHFPVPWSQDGQGCYMVTPAETRALLQDAGFEIVTMEDTGEKYLEAYQNMIARAERDELPPFGYHLLMGENALARTRNSARNIAEGRTHPIQVVCSKPL